MKKKIAMAFFAAVSTLAVWGDYTISVRRGALFLDEVANESSTPTTDSEFKYVSISGLSKYTLPSDVGKSVAATIKHKYLAVKDWGLTDNISGSFGKITWSGNTSATYTFAYDKAYEGKSLYLYIWLRWYRYNLTFDSNGGASISSMSNISCADGGYVTLPDMSRTGYAFNGWAKPTAGSNLSGRVGAEDIGVSSDGQTITLTAKWTANKYTVSYDSNGGSQYADKTVTYGSTYGSAIFVPVRSGYTFDGWFTEREGGAQITSSTTVEITAAQTLYAHWTANKYTASFDANGGSAAIASKTVAYGAAYGTAFDDGNLPSATRTGYTFQGWFTSSGGGTQITPSTAVSTASDHVLYAHWKANSYTVSFDANGGSPGIASKTVTYDSTYGTLPTSTRTGYTFDGWYTAKDGGTKVEPTAKFQIDAAQTLYAHWTAKTYTVSFDANGGSSTVASKTVTYDSTYGTLPTPTRTGYTFDGWYTAKSGGVKVVSTAKVQLTSTQTLYAHWTAKTYTVSFDANGGSSTTASKTVTYDSTYGDLPTPDRNGATFSGWYTAESGGTQITSSSKVAIVGNHSLYAHWEFDSLVVTFVGPDGTVIKEQSVEYGESADAPAHPEYVGMTFVDWDPSDFSNVISNVTVMARYVTNTYTVVYDPNGGSGEMTNEVFTYGIEYFLQSNKFKRGAMYEFLGWSTNQAATVAEFWEPACVSNLTSVANAEVKLYAVWKSLLTDYSIALDCTNLVIECTDGTWRIDENPESAYHSGSSVCVKAHELSEVSAHLSTTIDGPGTITFMVKVGSTSGKIDNFTFRLLGGQIDAEQIIEGKTTNGEWLLFTFYIDTPGVYQWMFVKKTNRDDDYVYIDQVHWYPGKKVDFVPESLQSWEESQVNRHMIRTTVLGRWNEILEGSSDKVLTIKIDMAFIQNMANASVTNALPLLNLGFAPSYAIAGAVATLSFTDAPEIAISGIDTWALPDIGMSVCVTNVSLGLPKWSDGVERSLVVWGAPTLTSGWSRVESSCDLSSYLTDGTAVFGFDAGTNRFFKVKAE